MKVDARSCSAVTVAEAGVTKSTREEFTDADKLFTYMIEPVTPPKFFKWVNLCVQCVCYIAVLLAIY